jgi:signal transduction histidine kinase
MTREQILQRLAEHRLVGGAPRAEHEWLATNGVYRCYKEGEIPYRKGERNGELLIVLSGRFGIHVDDRIGWRRVLEWKTGDLSGILPYSRMGGSPGDIVIEEDTESLNIHENLFPEIIRECPVVTAACVHVMLDRARTFNSAQLQDEKMISLGRVAAGLAHELNNPASAAVRSAQLLETSLDATASASRALGALQLDDAQLAVIERVRAVCVSASTTSSRSPLEQADREDEITEWLQSHGAETEVATELADTTLPIKALDMLADTLDGETLNVALRWLAEGSKARALTRDIERTTSRIHQLVSSIKRFTYMDRASVAEPVDVAQLLADTVTVLASKARGKSISLKLDIEPGLPKVSGMGGELNQVWMNLIDNALDAAPNGGHVTVSAKKEHGFLAVRVADDGPGIPGKVRPKIFDPFFTTKPPGQGTGLGLDIVQRVVRAHRAELDVSSVPGRTEFRVGLPLTDGAGAASPA